MENTKIKPKVMLHIIMPNQISGPNTAVRRMLQSCLTDRYEFGVVEQRFHAGGFINLKLIKDLYLQIKEFDPDIVHLTGLQSSGFHAVVAAKLAHKKVLLTVRGFAVDDMSAPAWKRFAFGKVIEPLTLKLSDRIYTVCDAAKNREEIQRFKSKVCDTVHNAAPEVNSSAFLKRDHYRKTLGFSSTDVVFAISGRMTFDKGIYTIIEAIEAQRNDDLFENAKYCFIGDGPALIDVKTRLADEIRNGKVVCLGQRNDVVDILCGCDVFLFATYHENLSNALLEAMACGLPVIATNIGGNPEVVSNCVNGFLIPEKSPDEISNAAHRLMENKSLRNEFGIKSRYIIEKSFSQSDLYKKIGEIYDDMV